MRSTKFTIGRLVRSLRHGIVAFSLLASAALATHATADEVILKDGSKIVGTVDQLTADAVKITTAYGELSLPKDQLVGVSSAGPVIVTLSSGEKAVGTLTYTADKGHVLTGTTAGDVAVNQEDIAGFVPASEANLQAAGLAEPTPETTAATDAKLDELKDRYIEALRNQEPNWDVKLNIGINGETGNSEAFSMYGGIDAVRTAYDNRLYLDMWGRLSERNGEQTSNEIQAGARWELDLTDRLFAYVKGRAEHDEIEGIKYRLTGTGGLGYFVFREPDMEWKVRGGLGYEHERRDDDSTEDSIIGELGYDFRKEIAPWLLFTNSFTYYPTLERLDDYRMEMDTAGEIPLTNDKDWKLRVGMRNTYDSETAPGVEKLDTFYYATVVLDLK
jgi:putative salt-induced outer membrane protein YdiY